LNSMGGVKPKHPMSILAEAYRKKAVQ